MHKVESCWSKFSDCLHAAKRFLSLTLSFLLSTCIFSDARLKTRMELTESEEHVVKASDESDDDNKIWFYHTTCEAVYFIWKHYPKAFRNNVSLQSAIFSSDYMFWTFLWCFTKISSQYLLACKEVSLYPPSFANLRSS